MRPADLIFPELYQRKLQGLCPTCGQPIGPFRDKLSEKEYGISGMCQACQDKVFNPPEDEE